MSSSDRLAFVAAAALSACMLAWAVLVPLAPWLGRGGGAPALVAAFADGAGALVCHQDPGRSFAARGRPWPVCARCSGIYVAAGLTVFVGLVTGVPRARLAGASAAAWRAAFAIALFPIALTWALEYSGVVAVSNTPRALSGVALGLVLAAVVLANLRALNHLRGVKS